MVLSTEPVGVVVRHDDPIGGQVGTNVHALDHRSWVRLPGSAGLAWRAYWSGTNAGQHPVGPEVRTIQECLQSVLWGGMIAIAPLHQPLPDGLVIVAATDREPNHLLLAWCAGRLTPTACDFVSMNATP